MASQCGSAPGSAQQVTQLAEELAGLSRQAFEALTLAAYVKMSAKDAAKYDKLRARSKEISTILGRYEPL
jgi:hypothetical protein